LSKSHITIGELPDYGDCSMLADRSSAQTLTSMAVLTLCAVPYTSRAAKMVEAGLRHYIIAKQLNDDLLDWQHDVKSGQASYVVTEILRDMDVKPGMYTLKKLIPTMRRHFRQIVIPKVAKHILHNVKQSQQLLTDSKLFKPSNDLYRLIQKLEQSVHSALDARKKAQDFYDTYH
jgi:hypothetical protein